MISCGIPPINATTGKSRGNSPIISVSLVKKYNDLWVYPSIFLSRYSSVHHPFTPLSMDEVITGYQLKEVVTTYHLGTCPHLREFPEKSQRDIAEQVGVSQPYVHRVKNEVITSYHLTRESTSDAQLPDRVIGKDGKSYPARRETGQVEAPMETNTRTNVLFT